MIDRSDPSLATQSHSDCPPPSSLHHHYLPPLEENKLHIPGASNIAWIIFYCDRSVFIFNLQTTTTITNQANTETLPLHS